MVFFHEKRHAKNSKIWKKNLWRSSNMAEAKKGSRRDAIGVATCHRLLGEGAQGARVSDEAARAARKHVKALLRDAAEACQKELDVTRKQTVSAGCVERAMLGHCNGVNKASLMPKGHKEDHRGLPQAGVERVVRKSLASKSRISEDAKKAYLGGAEAYLRELGKRSRDMALAGKRKTLLVGDVNMAAKHMTA
jgi:histone H3/H4